MATKKTSKSRSNETFGDIVRALVQESVTLKFIWRYKKFFLSILALIVLGVAGFVVAYRATETTVTFTVTQKPLRQLDAQQYSNLIYTDKGVYENVDSWSFLKFRSSDVYNQIQEGHTYTCRVAGWRIGLFSNYKNVIDCDGFVYY